MQLATIPQNLTMTSREIAALTGKEVSHVNRDIRKMLDELKKDDPNMDHPKEDKDSRGYTTCFHLRRELTDCLLTGYSASARMRVIKRWQELEAQPAKPPVIRNQNLAMIIQMATEMDAIQTAQQQQAIELAAVQKEIKTIGARSQPDTEFFTVLGYANLAGKKIDYKAAAQLGKKCKAMSDQCGYMTPSAASLGLQAGVKSA